MSCVIYPEDDEYNAVVIEHYHAFFTAIEQALDRLKHKATMPSGVEVDDYNYFVEDIQTALNNRANQEL